MFWRRRKSNPLTTDSLSDAQLEFLSRLFVMDKQTSDYWQSSVGNVEDLIENLLRIDLIKEASLADKVEYQFRLPDLKKLAKQYDTKRSGKKAAIIEALLEVMPEAEASTLVPQMRAYSLTENGKATVATYKHRLKELQRQREEEALRFLVNGQVKNAVRALGLNTDELWDQQEAKATFFIAHPYDEVQVSSEKKQLIGAYLALTELKGGDFGLCLRDIQEELGGLFPCPAVETYLRGTPQGFSATYNADSPTDVAEIYLLSKTRFATNSYRLKQLLDSDLRTRRNIGIRISSLEDTCTICNGGKNDFLWAEIDQLPTLPRHWGCRCDYTMLTQRSE